MISIWVFRKRVDGEPRLGVRVEKVEETEEPVCDCKPQVITIEAPKEEAEEKEPLCRTCKHVYITLSGTRCNITKSPTTETYAPCDLYEKARGCMECACRISEPMKAANGKEYVLCRRFRWKDNISSLTEGLVVKEWEELRNRCEYFRDESGDPSGTATEVPSEPVEEKKCKGKCKRKDKTDEAISGTETAGKA